MYMSAFMREWDRVWLTFLERVEVVEVACCEVEMDDVFGAGGVPSLGEGVGLLREGQVVFHLHW